jgi:hypothetical protein
VTLSETLPEECWDMAGQGGTFFELLEASFVGQTLWGKLCGANFVGQTL